MNDKDIANFLENLSRVKNEEPKLVETHISWVILSGDFAYKLKKPIKTTFLDFKSLKNRQFYSEKELSLNRRLAEQVYISVKPVIKSAGKIVIANGPGRIIDYALLMKRLDSSKRMDLVLKEGKLKSPDIKRIASKVAEFHRNAEIIKKRFFTRSLVSAFNDIASTIDTIEKYIGDRYVSLVGYSIDMSSEFIEANKAFINSRVKNGYIRDVHGDLHTANIFIYKDPIIYDCIEFNDSFRSIDLLNDIAFLSMDLDYWGREDLSKLFLSQYLNNSSWKLNEDEMNLLLYYKGYRANIRAKVHLLRIEQLAGSQLISKEVKVVKKYLKLMEKYLKEIKTKKGG